MRAREFDEFDEIEALLEGGEQRNWIFFGLVLSLMLHLALCFWFYRTQFQSAEALFTEQPPPPTFKVRAVDLANIDKSSADMTNAAAKPEPDNTNVQLPDEIGRAHV